MVDHLWPVVVFLLNTQHLVVHPFSHQKLGEGSGRVHKILCVRMDVIVKFYAWSGWEGFNNFVKVPGLFLKEVNVTPYKSEFCGVFFYKTTNLSL